MSEIRLRVDPDTLQRKAGDVNDHIGDIEKLLNAITSSIDSSRSYWEGDASGNHQEKYRRAREELEEEIRQLRVHPRHLLEMAGLYRQTETENQQTAADLPADIIS